MEKALSTSGHSLALVIDRPIARLLGLVRESRVRLTIEGGSLIVTPTGDVTEKTRPARDITDDPTYTPKKRAPSITTREVLRLLGDLDAYGMPDREFQRISDGERMAEFGGRANGGLVLDPITLARMVHCMKRRHANKESWESTVDAVLQEFPRP